MDGRGRPAWVALVCAVGVFVLASGAVVASAATDYVLTVRTHGLGVGAVTSEPAGIDCGATCSAAFEEGTLVRLTATPDPGWVFAGWDGVCSGLGTCELLIDSAHDVGATFSPAPAEVLTVRTHGAGSGLVTSAPAGIECGETCSAGFDKGEIVTLTATPDPGYDFAGWGGACGGSGGCEVTMDVAHDVSAHFQPSPKADPEPTPVPPRTRITRAVVDSRQRLAALSFAAREGSVAFQCSLRPRGKAPVFSSCRSPRTYRGLKLGRYLFAVRALGAGGTGAPAKRALRIR